MSRHAIGSRIGALLSATDSEAFLLGYGVYDGDLEPPFGMLGMSKEEMEEMKKDGTIPQDFIYTNPRMTLDDGTVVWGAQCWWGSEEVIRKKIEGLKITLVDIEGNPK